MPIHVYPDIIYIYVIYMEICTNNTNICTYSKIYIYNIGRMIWEQYKCAQEGVNKISLQKILTSNFFLCGRFEYGFQYNTFEYFCGWDGITFLTNIFCIRNIFFSDYFYQLKYVSMSHGSPIFWTFPPWKHQKIGGSEIVIVAKWLIRSYERFKYFSRS